MPLRCPFSPATCRATGTWSHDDRLATITRAWFCNERVNASFLKLLPQTAGDFYLMSDPRGLVEARSGHQRAMVPALRPHASQGLAPAKSCCAPRQLCSRLLIPQRRLPDRPGTRQPLHLRRPPPDPEGQEASTAAPLVCTQPRWTPGWWTRSGWALRRLHGSHLVAGREVQ